MRQLADRQGEDNWVQPVIRQAVQERWCYATWCTTCGSFEIRRALISAAEGNQTTDHLPRLAPVAGKLVDGLSRCQPPNRYDAQEPSQYEQEEVIRWILYKLWSEVGAETADKELFPLLAGSWAGEVLDQMRKHYARRGQR